MNENIFGMSIDDINSDKVINLADEYNFRTIDEDILGIDNLKSSNATNVFPAEVTNENTTNVK